MHNRFESLLKRCKKRNRAILMKRLFFALLGLLFFAAATYMTNSASSIFGVDESQDAELTAVRKEPARNTAVIEPVKKAKEETKKEVASKANKAVEQKRPKRVEREVVKKEQKSTPPLAKKSDAPTLLSSHKSETNSSITVKEEPAKGRKETVLQVKEVSDMDALLEQYKNSPRYSVALKIAQLYFDDGDFEKASLWARKANLLDRDDERAWLIYAQSEYALGREKRAERILRLYLDYKDSPKARSLLMTWSSQ